MSVDTDKWIAQTLAGLGDVNPRAAGDPYYVGFYQKRLAMARLGMATWAATDSFWDPYDVGLMRPYAGALQVVDAVGNRASLWASGVFADVLMSAPLGTTMADGATGTWVGVGGIDTPGPVVIRRNTGANAFSVVRQSDGATTINFNADGIANFKSYVTVDNGQPTPNVDVAMWGSQVAFSSAGQVIWSPDAAFYTTPDLRLFRERVGSLGVFNPTSGLWANVHLGSTTYPDNSVQTTAFRGIGATQTPWLSNIDANRHALQNTSLVSIFPANPTDVAFGVLKTDGSVWHWFIDGGGGMHSQTGAGIATTGDIAGGTVSCAVVAASSYISLMNRKDSTADLILYDSQMQMTNRGRFMWSAGLNVWDVPDVTLERRSVAQLVITDGSGGYGDLLTRTLYALSSAGATTAYVRGSDGVIVATSYYSMSGPMVIDAVGQYVGTGIFTSGSVVINSPGNLHMRGNGLYMQNAAGDVTNGHINSLGAFYAATYYMWPSQTQVINSDGVFNGIGIDIGGGTGNGGNWMGRNQVAVYDLTSGAQQIHIALYDRRLSMSNTGTINWNPDNTYYTPGDIRLGRYDANTIYISDPGTNARKDLLLRNLSAESVVQANSKVIVLNSSADYQFQVIDAAGTNWSWLLRQSDGALFSPVNCAFQAGLVTAASYINTPYVQFGSDPATTISRAGANTLTTSGACLFNAGYFVAYPQVASSAGFLAASVPSGGIGVQVNRASDGAAAVVLTERGDVNALNSVSVYNGLDGKVDAALYGQRLALTNRGYIGWTSDLNWFNAVDVFIRKYDEAGPGQLLLEKAAGGGGSLTLLNLNAWGNVAVGNGLNVTGNANVTGAYVGYPPAGNYQFHLMNPNNSQWNWLVDPNGNFTSPNNCSFQAGQINANGSMYATGDVSGTRFIAEGAIGMGTGAAQFTFRDLDGRTIWVRGGLVVSVT